MPRTRRATRRRCSSSRRDSFTAFSVPFALSAVYHGEENAQGRSGAGGCVLFLRRRVRANDWRRRPAVLAATRKPIRDVSLKHKGYRFAQPDGYCRNALRTKWVPTLPEFIYATEGLRSRVSAFVVFNCSCIGYLNLGLGPSGQRSSDRRQFGVQGTYDHVISR